MHDDTENGKDVSRPGPSPGADSEPASRPERESDLHPEAQRRALLDAQRKAHQDEPRNVKEDALTDKLITVEPDGTGPTSTKTFDPEADQTDPPRDSAGAGTARGPGTSPPAAGSKPG